MPDYTNEQIAFQTKAAEIAAEISARVDAPAPQGTSTSPEIVATSPQEVAAPKAEASDISKLLARLADSEQKISEMMKQRATPPSEQRQEAPQKPQNLNPRQAYLDPEAYLQSQGVDPQAFLRTMVARAMGDQADPQLKTEARFSGELAATHSELSQLKDMVTSLTNELHRRDYQQNLTEYTAGVDREKYPTVAALYQKDAKKTQEALMQIVVSHAREHGASAPLTPDEAIARMEASYSWLPLSASNPTAASQPSQTAPVAKPLIPSALPGAPPTKLASNDVPFEQKVAAILEDVQRKFGIV